MKANLLPLKYSIVNKKIPTYIKLLVNSNNKRIIAAHMFGEEAPEIIQVLAVSMQANATIYNFNNAMAIHPTVAEELVTFKGPSRKFKKSVIMEKQWNKNSWRKYPISQQPIYENIELVKEVEAEIEQLPPLVFADEVRKLKQKLADVSEGKAFLLQGGIALRVF